VTEPLAIEPRRKGLRWRYAIIALLCAGAVVWMLVLMQRNVVFFKTVSEAVPDRASDGSKSLRIGGGVVPDSIRERDDGVDFELTEGGVTVRIHHVGSEPSLFKDCAPVVAEGRWSKNDASTFDSNRLLIKHGNDYRPPEGAAAGQCPPDPIDR
jgi:cytochrome c-type biogenesis protein CcmE